MSNVLEDQKLAWDTAKLFLTDNTRLTSPTPNEVIPQ